MHRHVRSIETLWHRGNHVKYNQKVYKTLDLVNVKFVTRQTFQPFVERSFKETLSLQTLSVVRSLYPPSTTISGRIFTNVTPPGNNGQLCTTFPLGRPGGVSKWYKIWLHSFAFHDLAT